MRAARAASAAALVALIAAPGAALASESGSYEVTYQGDSAGFSASGDDFFSHFPTLMPGDTACGTIALSNSSEHTQRMFFGADCAQAQSGESSAQADQDVLDLIRLTVSSQRAGDEIYQGTLRSPELEEALALGTFAPDEHDLITFEVSLPAEVGNDHALDTASVSWVFSAEEVPDEPTPAPSWPEGATFSKTGRDVLAAFAASALLAASGTVALVRALRRTSLRARTLKPPRF